jgi:hypothetical protein
MLNRVETKLILNILYSYSVSAVPRLISVFVLLFFFFFYLKCTCFDNVAKQVIKTIYDEQKLSQTLNRVEKYVLYELKSTPFSNTII